jgi:hypothetical protein
VFALDLSGPSFEAAMQLCQVGKERMEMGVLVTDGVREDGFLTHVCSWSGQKSDKIK